MRDSVVTSPANPRVKALVALRRRREREARRLTVVEGYAELCLALDAGVVPRSLYYCPELMPVPTAGSTVVARVSEAGTELVRLSRAAFERAAYREGPDGILAVVDAVGGSACADLSVPGDALLLVCQAVEKPGNLGAMLRTADAAGVAAVVAVDPVTDWGNPNLVRASKGTVFALAVAADTTDGTLAWLRASDTVLVAATPDADADYTAVDYRSRVAVAVGAERSGLTGELLGAADHRVRIPMAGRVNSLNVATSAAVLLYEAVRQRMAAAAARDRGTHGRVGA